MKTIIKGKVYYYIDTIMEDEIVYDVYEDEYGEIYYKCIDTNY